MPKILPTKKTAEVVLSKLLSRNDLIQIKTQTQVVLMVGMPGSGKSTISELLASAYGFWRFSSDQIRVSELFPDQDHRTGDYKQVKEDRTLVYQELKRRVIEAVNQGQKVVIDSTNLDDKREIILKGLLEVIDPKKISFVIVKTPKKIMTNRFGHEGEESAINWHNLYETWVGYLKTGEAAYPTKKSYPGTHFARVKRYDLETFDWITQIGVIVWDVDKTLYNQIPQLNQAIQQQLLNRIAEKKKITTQEAEVLFDQLFAELHSTTLSLNKLGFNGRKTIDQIVQEIKIESFLKPDPRLKKLITKLPQFHHVILSNASEQSTLLKLKALGLPPKLFSAIYATYELPVVKPDKRVFEHIIKQTGFSPHQHLTVGDEVAKDLLPAKSVGMRTALVWGSDPKADVSFDTVYGVGRLFGVEV